MLVRAAHAVYSRWERLPPLEHERLRAAADQVKQLALDLRGRLDSGPAERELGQASRRLATGIMDAAGSDPRLSDSDLAALREDLAHELRRFAGRSATRKAA